MTKRMYNRLVLTSAIKKYWYLIAVLRIRDIMVWIRGSVPLINGSASGTGSGSCYFDLQDANKKLTFLSFSAHYFLKVHFTFFFK